MISCWKFQLSIIGIHQTWTSTLIVDIVHFSLNIMLEESQYFRCCEYLDVCTLFLLYIVKFVKYDGTKEFFTL